MGKKQAQPWKNRIVDHGEEQVDAILFNPANWRIHPKAQQEALEGVLSEVGWVQDVIVNRTTGHLVDGHLRCQVATRNRKKTVPMVYVELSEAEEALILASIDPIAAMAATDKAKLDELMLAVKSDDERVQAMLAEIAEKEGLGYGRKEPIGKDPGVDESLADQLQKKWNTATGQTWSCGENKIICGDSTDKDVITQLVGDERADMVWTDPPYGVAIGDKNKFLNSIARSNRIEENFENDTLSEPELVAMLCAAFDNAIAVCTAGAAWHVAAPPGPLHVLFGQVLKDRGIWRQTIQWVKNNATFAPLGVCYHWRAEPIFFGWLPNGSHRYYGGRKQDTVWNIDRPIASPEHPTIKPVELVERAIENHTKPKEIVLDIFGGSGTTMIACERMDRRARLVEISPAYVAVTLERWSTMTGLTPVLLE